MLGKLTDTANILKAKITKDQLQQKLVLATSQQNWQAPTNILHEIANSAYNYEKWQKINDFIWQKLKKKSTWRKIMKTLNLVQFLLKNGPPSAISSFKYDIYQFRSYSDYQAYDQGIDRGQAIRQKSKQIVELLSNDQHLQQQRQKAKKIRDRMAGITGGMNYGTSGGGSGSGGYGSDKYQSFNNKSYTDKKSTYGSSNDYQGGLGMYGDYSYGGKSTLDKYKTDKDGKNTGSGGKAVDITGGAGTVEGMSTKEQTKKPFQKIAGKLAKPPSKTVIDSGAGKSIVGNAGTTPEVAKQNTSNKNKDIIDIFDIVQPASTPSTNTNTNTSTSTQQPQTQTQPQVNNSSYVNGNNVQHTQQEQHHTQQTQQTQHNQQTQQTQPQYTQPQPSINQLYTQPYGQQPPYGQPQYGQPQYGQPQYGQPQYGQSQYGQPQYGQPQYGQPMNQPYGQPQYGQPQYGSLYPPQQYQQQPHYPAQQPYIQPTQIYTQPYSQPQTQTQTYTQPQQITLSTTSNKTHEDDFGKFESAPSQATANVKWLSNDEKGLIDFSDFSSDMKNNNLSSPPKPKQEKGNNVKIDPWNW